MKFLSRAQQAPNPQYLTQILDLFSEELGYACVWLNVEKEIFYINESAEQILGKNTSIREQSIGNLYTKYSLGKNFNSPLRGIFQEIKHNQILSTVIEWSFLPIKNKKETTSILMVGRDIRKSLKDKNSYLYNIMNNVPHTIFWKNRESVFLGCNEAFAKAAQLDSPASIVGLTDYELPWGKFESDAYRAHDQAVMEADQPQLNIEETQTLASGKKIVLLTSKVPLHDKNGRVNGVLGVYTDITEQKKVEKKLEKAKKDAEELKRTTYLLKGAKLISGSIAHEIRTPLATMKSTAWNLERQFNKLISEGASSFSEEEIESVKKGLSIINKKVDQSNNIINMLLTKLQSLDFESSEFTVCSAHECIREAFDEFLIPDSMRGKIKFTEADDFKFMGNRILIVHVLMNLLKNAIFYVQKAKKGKISIWTELGEEENRIHFKDTGMGISKEVLPHIFDAFFTTEASTGTGVGLAFSKMVMQSHHGEITCRSEEGKYTEFVLSFPKKDTEL